MHICKGFDLHYSGNKYLVLGKWGIFLALLVCEMMFRHSSFCLLFGKPKKWLLKGFVAWKPPKLSLTCLRVFHYKVWVTIQTVTQSFYYSSMLFCFTYFFFLWSACIVSQLKQLQVLVENNHSCYIYCNIGIHKNDKKIIQCCTRLFHHLLVFDLLLVVKDAYLGSNQSESSTYH